MGCGQSKIGNIYPKNKKNKGSVKKNDESISEFTISITFFFFFKALFMFAILHFLIFYMV